MTDTEDQDLQIIIEQELQEELQKYAEDLEEYSIQLDHE